MLSSAFTKKVLLLVFTVFILHCFRNVFIFRIWELFIRRGSRFVGSIPLDRNVPRLLDQDVGWRLKRNFSILCLFQSCCRSNQKKIKEEFCSKTKKIEFRQCSEKGLAFYKKRMNKVAFLHRNLSNDLHNFLVSASRTSLERLPTVQAPLSRTPGLDWMAIFTLSCTLGRQGGCKRWQIVTMAIVVED